MIKRRLRALPLLLLTAMPAWAQLGPVPLSGQAVQAQGAAAARPLAQKLSDQLSIQDFGAVCNGIADDSNAVIAAGQSGRRVVVPSGVTCNAPGVPQASMQGVFLGGGQIKGSDGNPRGPQFGAVRAPPNPQVWNSAVDVANVPGTNPEDNCAAGFPCWGKFDYSHTLSAEEFHVSGAATAGTPMHGYEGMPGVNAHTLLMDSNSGWNYSHNSNDGRTGLSAYNVVLQTNGGGDTGVYGAQILCKGLTPPGDGNTAPGPNGIINGYTDWLAVPNCGFEGGNLSALAPGQYLQVGEFHVNDYGNDISAIGQAMGYNRTATTKLINNRWINELATCNLTRAANAIPCDAAYVIGGQWLIGLDFVGDPAIQNLGATVAQMAGQKITLNGTLNDPTGEGNPGLTALGGDWLTDDGYSVLIAQNGSTAIRLSNQASAVDFWSVTGATHGNAVVMQASGPDASIPILFADQGSGGVLFQSNNSLALAMANPANATGYLHYQGPSAGNGAQLAVYSGSSNDFQLAASGTGLVRVIGTQPAATDSSTAVATTGFTQGVVKTAVTAMTGNRFKIVNVGSGVVGTLTVQPGVIDQMIVEITPNAPTIGTMNLTMPASTAIPDGFIIHFITTGTITTFTLTGNTGQSVLGAPGTITPATPVAFMWDNGLGDWIPFR